MRGSMCQIVDPKSGSLWRALQEDFFAGDQIYGETENARTARWGYEPGVVHKSFGFEQSQLDNVSSVTLVLTEVLHNKSTVLLFVISVLGIQLSFAAVMRQVRLKGSGGRRIVLGLAYSIPIPVFGFYGFLAAAVLSPSSSLFWSSVILGTTMSVGALWGLKQLYSRTLR